MITTGGPLFSQVHFSQSIGALGQSNEQLNISEL
jgi:hypothetical protein